MFPSKPEDGSKRSPRTPRVRRPSVVSRAKRQPEVSATSRPPGLKATELKRILPQPPKQAPIPVRNHNLPEARPAQLIWHSQMAFNPPEAGLPQGFVRLGGIPVKHTPQGPVLPELEDIRSRFHPRAFEVTDWLTWERLLPRLDPCLFVPAKATRVEIPVLGPTRLCHVSGDCTRAYTVDELGRGCVVNLLTDAVDATFVVAPDPNASHPVPNPIVNPFTKGGINHKYRRLYVPASFHGQLRTGTDGGFYVAVVDVSPASATYLSTIGYIPCGWIPEEVAFTPDGEIGVIANHLQGTATFFEAASGRILAAELDGFTGAKAHAPGGAWARSVRCADVPGKGKRAFLTLTDESLSTPGVGIFDLDSPSFARTNFTHPSFGFVDGVAVTPDQRRILLVDGYRQLHVVRVDGPSPVLERSIALPAGNHAYFGGIAVRPSGDLCFIATGAADPVAADQGTQLLQVHYLTGTVVEIPNGLPPQSWGLAIRSFGRPLKPHIFVCSLRGKLTILPC